MKKFSNKKTDVLCGGFHAGVDRIAGRGVIGVAFRAARVPYDVVTENRFPDVENRYRLSFSNVAMSRMPYLPATSTVPSPVSLSKP